MDFTLSTLASSICALVAPNTVAISYPPVFMMGKRRQLAPPSSDTLPKQPLTIRAVKDTTTSTATSFHQPCISKDLIKGTKNAKACSDDDDDDDDDTASTVSYSTSTDISLDVEDEEDTTCLFSPTKNNKNNTNKSVSFAYPVVTQVRTRPNTTREDKYYLHYSEADYLDFKIGFITGKDRNRKVSFARNVVSKVISIPAITSSTTDQAMKQVFYYSESELQRFLDEFVQSLHQGV